ncbi:MAG: twitching motility protein PilT [Paucimonas sp.]|nr:twitching motility protein PilT [Paucimonas sp.]
MAESISTHQETALQFRFHGVLNQFVARRCRDCLFTVTCPPGATAKHMIEALGVPHTEVGLVLAGACELPLDALLEDGMQLSVFPFTGSALAGREPDPPLRFVADAHLGGLARLLRMAGYDTLYDNSYADAAIVRLAGEQQRIVLTRDRDLLKRRALAHGYHVWATQPDEQLAELGRRYPLARQLHPFALCLACNAALADVEPARLAARVPPRVRERHARFKQCPCCLRVYWEGSHWAAMRARLEKLLPPAADNAPGFAGATACAAGPAPLVPRSEVPLVPQR